MRRALQLVLLGACTSVALHFAAPAQAQAEGAGDPRMWLQRGIDAYQRGLQNAEAGGRRSDFESALLAFERARAAGVRSSHLELNLGNAALKGGRQGAAVLAYRRSLALDPHQPAARANLERAREQLPRWVPRPGAIDFGVSRALGAGALAPPTARLLGALCFAIGALIGAVAIHRRVPGFRTLAALFMAVWLLLSAWAWFEDGRPADTGAVVTQSEVRARAADSFRAEERLPAPLPAGSEVSIVEERADWARVRLADGAEVWLPVSALTRIAP